MSGALYRIVTIGRNTLLESVRQKVLNVLLIFAIVLVGASVWFSQMATPGLDAAGLFDAQIKFVKDAGCGAIGVFGFFIALLSTAQLIPQELHNRTIYTILAKPVRRSEFLLGKFLGVVLLLALCVALMSLAFAATLYVEELRGLSYVADTYARTDPHWRNSAYLLANYNHDAGLVVQQVQDPQLIEAILLLFAKLVMTSGLALLISTFATSSIFTIVTTFMVYLIGHMESTAREVWLAAAGGHPSLLGGTLAAVIAMLVPDLNAYTIIDEILAGNHVPWEHAWNLIGYAGAYLVVLLALSVVIFEYREI
jgi:ABC-type transport system involved in multi-copper enzyme maturation permease subunit